ERFTDLGVVLDDENASLGGAAIHDTPRAAVAVAEDWPATVAPAGATLRWHVRCNSIGMARGPPAAGATKGADARCHNQRRAKPRNPPATAPRSHPARLGTEAVGAGARGGPAHAVAAHRLRSAAARAHGPHLRGGERRRHARSRDRGGQAARTKAPGRRVPAQRRAP